VLLSFDVSGVVVVDLVLIIVVIGDVPGISVPSFFKNAIFVDALLSGGIVGTPVCSNIVVV